MAKYQLPVRLTNSQQYQQAFQPLPSATGAYPFHLNLEDVLGQRSTEQYSTSMSFHMLGDTGSVKHSAFQKSVARCLAQQCALDQQQAPAFLYHLGDIVYNYGEAEEYPSQFFTPYSQYPAPIFAIPGNHDGDINPLSAVPPKSLEAYMQVFCQPGPAPDTIDFSAEEMPSWVPTRQPNPYWTLITPLARFIGLYGNISKHGYFNQEQIEWFTKELLACKQDQQQRACIVCVHHAPYSADSNHGSSTPVIDLLENAFKEADFTPDLVCSGHVHNYQRFEQIRPEGKSLTYLVAGAGGYADLHQLAELDAAQIEPLDEKGTIQLMNYCDKAFGFLKLAIEKQDAELKIQVQYYTLESPEDQEATLFEQVVIPVENRDLSLV